jgi:hypothetical protein
MTYYQVEFSAGGSTGREPKRFRTEEKAKQHAKKVLGLAAESSLGSRATILPVSRNRAPLQ